MEAGFAGTIAPDVAHDADATVTDGETVTREFYYLNLLSILGNNLAADRIGRLAEMAVKNRNSEKSYFSRRLSLMLEEFRAEERSCSVSEVDVLAPTLKGWAKEQLDLISTLRRQYGGLLVALFHFGAHRHIVLDLAALGIPLSAPVAGQAYWNYYNLRQQAPPQFAAGLKLIEVESRAVGRELLVDVRRGRVGAIYVDGNMGPDGHHVDEGATTISFLDHRARVKAGIGRIAMALDVPILPVFATSIRDPDGARVVLGTPILPGSHGSNEVRVCTKDVSLQAIMGALYSQLETRIIDNPSAWEYALCFHRWLEERESRASDEAAINEEISAAFDSGGVAKLNSSRVAVMHRGGVEIWVDVHRQQGYPLPSWFESYATLLRSHCGVTNDLISAESSDQSLGRRVIGLVHELIKRNLVTVGQQGKQAR